MGERTDAIQDVDRMIETARRVADFAYQQGISDAVAVEDLIGYAEQQRALVAAAPPLPGGGEAEARLAGLRARNAMLEGEIERLRSLLPGGEEADAHCAICGARCSRDCRTVGESQFRADEVETVARAMWDARETRDPSGERTGYTEDDQTREPVFWDQAVAEDRWPGSRREQLEEARLVLDCINLYGDEVLHKALDDIGFAPRSTRPDAERAPQEYGEIISHHPEGPDQIVPPSESRPQGDEVETVARAIRGFAPMCDSIAAAHRVLAALDARSGADTVKLADVAEAARGLRWNVRDPYSDDTDVIVEGESWKRLQRTLFPSGADRPEGGQR